MTSRYTDPEFFLVGMQRSGTTLLQAIINASGQMELTDECWWIPGMQKGRDLYEAYFTRGSNEGWDDAIRLMHRELMKKAHRFGLQTIGCQNACHADYLHTLYPTAKFIHMVRDPRDTLISTLRTGIFSSPRAFEDAYAVLSRFYETSGVDYHILRYEELTTTPVESLKELCDFISIEYTADMLAPLTRSISHNVSPALSADDLEARTIKPDTSVTQRWRRQLPTLDLLDLNDLFPTLKTLGYPVYDTQKMTLRIDGDAIEGAQLIGASLHGNDTTTVNKTTVLIDLHSVGAAGLRFPQKSRVRSVLLEEVGAFEQSEHDDTLYVFRFDPLEENIRFDYTSWNGLLEAHPDLAGKRLALHSAGGATKGFLKEFYARGLDDTFTFSAILDKSATGSMHGIPIIPTTDADLDDYDLILITSFAYYSEIKQELESRGLKEFADFTAVMFPNQDLVRWW